MRAIFVFGMISVSSVISFDCTSDGDCQVKNAICVNKTCACPADYITNSIATECIKIAHGLGADCTDNLQCSASLLSGGFCNNSTCDCEPGYHYFLGNCWKTAGLFEKCYVDNNCFVDHDFESSVCSPEKICVCKDGYYQREYSSCRRISNKPGDPCGIPMDCHFDNAICLWNHTCSIGNASFQLRPIDATVIPNNYLKEAKSADNSQQKLAVSSQIGDKCDSATACPANADCATGVCECQLGFFTLDQKSCHPEVGALCSTNADCIGRNMYCGDKNYCTCAEGHIISEDRRYCDKLSRFIGWSCLRDAWCAYFGPGAICLDKSCACSNSTRYVAEQMFCWVEKRAGESCQNDLDCGLDNMSCKDGTCQCEAGSHASSNGTVCRPDAPVPGDRCEENIDCMFPHSSCDNSTGKCVCASKYILNGTACVSGIGGPCDEKHSCTLDHSSCVNETCVCIDEFVPPASGGVCLPVQRTMGGPCQDDSQCVPKFDGVCLNDRCQCPPDHHYVNGTKCFKNVPLNSPCTMDGECVEHASCLKYICTCDHGYTVNSNVCSGAEPIVRFGLFALVAVISNVIYPMKMKA